MLYTMNQVQDMLTKVKNDAKLKTAILKCFAHDHADQNAVADVISSGWVERFDRYDSAVCDDFIRAFEKCTKKRLKESKMRDYELELEFKIKFKNPITEEEMDLVAANLNSYFVGNKSIPGDLVGLYDVTGMAPGRPVIEPEDIRYNAQYIYLLLYYTFEGNIEWDEDGIGRPLYSFDGAPDDEESFITSIKNIVCTTSGVDLKPDDVMVEWLGKSLDDHLEEIATCGFYYDAPYESKSVIGQLMEGTKIRNILL